MGVLIILLACFGVSSLIGLSSVTFPASVALLLVLFFALIICDLVIGSKRTAAIVKLIDIPVQLPRVPIIVSKLTSEGWLCSSIHQHYLHPSVRGHDVFALFHLY